QFTATVTGGTGGLLQLFTSGSVSTVARGSVSHGQLLGAAYASLIHYGKRQDEVRIVMSNGAVKDTLTDPPTAPNPDRVPLSDAHRRNVTDPLTGLIIPVAGTGDIFVPEACPRKLAVFDGRMR